MVPAATPPMSGAAPSGPGQGVRSFRYRALDGAGHVVSGQVEAPGEREALRALLGQDLTPLDINAVQGAAPGAGQALFLRAPRGADCIQLLEEMATLLKAGVSLGEAMPSLAEAYARTALGGPLAAMTRSVRAGTGLGVAFREAALPLPRYALALVDAGEASGAMSEALADAARPDGRGSPDAPGIAQCPDVSGRSGGLGRLCHPDRVHCRGAALCHASEGGARRDTRGLPRRD